MVAPLIAAKAYAAVQGAAADGIAGAPRAAAGPDFGQMVSQVINQTVTDSEAPPRPRSPPRCRARPTWSTW